MIPLLNSQRLAHLAQFHPKLQNIWYLVAAVTFSVCNQPQEIPTLYHYAMMLHSDTDKRDPSILASRTIDMLRYESSALRTLIDETYSKPTSLQRVLTEKFRETLLKTGPLAGLPKAINVLTKLKEVTPTGLLPQTQEIDPFEAAKGNEEPYTRTIRNSSSSAKDNEETTQRGLKHWNHIYSKVSKRVVNNLNSAYPDLWYYILVHVYGPLLSFDEVLSAEETSLIVIASLVPQDVSPQLRGHLKGALNVGCDSETIEAVRNLAVVISQWCGVSWKSDAVKL